jgi:hypothetical protein
MTKSEQVKLQMLEIENQELRRMNSRHIEVYRDLINELITLRSRNEYVNQLLTEALREVAT